ncbi:MAG: hypothetical protein ACT4OO_09735 [Nitrospiraceae bacterium]
MLQSIRTPVVILALTLDSLLVMTPGLASVGEMANDPKGFEGIPWGAAFSESTEFGVVEQGDRIKGYELRQGTPPLGPAKVDAMRFFTIDGKFARVLVRYHGTNTHQQILNYLQSQFGSLDKTPGQMARGPVQQFNWQGDDTAITMTYEAGTDRGIIFFESRSLASKFGEGMAPEPDHAGATY